MFELRSDRFDTIIRNNIHYLYADSNMFGDCKFGDLMMYSTYLYYLKKYILFYWPNKFNRDNIFFIFNIRDQIKIDDLQIILSLFNSVWKGYDIIEGGKYNINQLVTRGNIWSFKTYLENNNIHLTDDDVPIINPFNVGVSYNKRNSVFIYPVRDKDYNVERNMSLTDIISVIDNVSIRDRIYLITKGNGLDFSDIRAHTNRNLTEINDDINWTEILFMIMSMCKLYVGGDCGLSHFVGLIDKLYQPEMKIYYNTTPLIMKDKINEFDKGVDEVTFTPYNAYKESSLTIINLTGK
jgi:hypothetical protein